MMKKFEMAQLEVVRFERDDVVVASCSSVCGYECLVDGCPLHVVCEGNCHVVNNGVCGTVG